MPKYHLPTTGQTATDFKEACTVSIANLTGSTDPAAQQTIEHLEMEIVLADVCPEDHIDGLGPEYSEHGVKHAWIEV